MNNELLDRLSAALADRYTIERELGEGGMATVFLAEDLKHRRKVALKVLKPELAAVVGAERFLAEIETTAHLSHPHILPLHDSGEADSFLFYVMPYVDGESLRDRLDRERQLPVDEAVRIAVALAGALDHAHNRGVIHRDIKPANVLLQDGQPVMADFGIALAVGAAGGARLTETGLSVGTPYYMSPEQATGDQVIGPASDIYALACVLYEMLLGEPPFPGATAQAVLGKIISGTYPRPTEVRPQVPANVDAALRKALEKLAADRFPTAAAFAKALSDPGFRYGAEAAVASGDGGRWKRIAVGASAAAVVLAGVTGWALSRGQAPRPVARYAVQLPPGHDINRVVGPNLTLSPDGSVMVYAGPRTDGQSGSQLWLRRRDQLDPQAIPGTEGAFSPTFSPDGTKVAFVIPGPPAAVKVASLGGEPPITVVSDGVAGSSVAWGGDGYLYYDGPTDIVRVSATGGKPESVTVADTAKGEAFHVWPAPLPDGKGFIFTVVYQPNSDITKYNLAVARAGSMEHTTLVRGVYPRITSDGHLIYVTADGTLLAVAFDEGKMALAGTPVALTQGVGINQFGATSIDVSADGTLAYVTGGVVNGSARVVWVTRDGTVTPVDSTWNYDPGFPEAAVALSPDNKRLAVKINTEAGEDIWVKELDRGPLSRLTFDPAADRRPRWSPDGSRILFTSDRGGQDDLWSQPADGTGSAELLLHLSRTIAEEEQTPDGKTFVIRLGGVANSTGMRDLVAVHLGDTVTTPVAAEPYDEKAVTMSPDGRWVAYESTETGRDEVYVRPFPDANGGKWQVSTGGGINPLWSRDGREIFYVDGGGEMTAAQVETQAGAGGGFRVGERKPLFNITDRQIYAQDNYRSWDAARDGKRFIMIQFAGSDDKKPHDLIVVENFFQELKEKVSGK
jgi:Tol biopolymer transport system component